MSLNPAEYDKLFFPDSGRSIKKAREFCKMCPVKDDCLEFALNNDCVGIWAGTNYEERKGIISFRNIMTATESLDNAPVAVTVVTVESRQLKTPLKVSKTSKPDPKHKINVGKRKARRKKIRRSNFKAVE